MAAPPAVVPLPGATNKANTSLPTSAPASKGSAHPPSSNEHDVPSEASSPMLETPTSAILPTAKPGSRDGAPYSDAEVRLIEQVIREALRKQPEIKLAQLGVLIHAKDPSRPATAWARQLSKRKQAIERARELVRNGKDISQYPIDVNSKENVYAEEDTDGEGGGFFKGGRKKAVADDDDEYDDRPHKRRKGL